MGKGKKAANGSGSIWQRKDGRYNAALTYPYHDPDTGKTRRRRETTTKSSWDAAHKWLVGKKHDHLVGHTEQTGEDPYLSDYLDSWLADIVEPARSRNTYLKREYSVRVHLSPALGHAKLSEVEPRRIQGLYSKLARDGFALATRREVHVTLRMALEQAVKWGMLRRNPCDLVDTPKQDALVFDEDDEEIRAVSDEEVRRLFEYAERKLSRWRYFYVVAIRVGLRPGEMLGLRWGDLALEGDPGSLKVRRTLDTHYSPPVFNPPKSKASRRTVALHWEAQDALTFQRQMLAGEGLPTGEKALVFPSIKGTPMNSRNLARRSLHPDLAAAGLPELTLHELRHTFASIMLHEWRVSPSIVQEMMGHDDITTTMKIYGHLFPGAQEQAIRDLRKMHGGPKESGNRDTTRAAIGT